MHHHLHLRHINLHHGQPLKLKDAFKKPLFLPHLTAQSCPFSSLWTMNFNCLKTKNGGQLMWMNPLGVHPARLSSHTAAALIFIHMRRGSSESWPLRAMDGGRNRGREGERWRNSRRCSLCSEQIGGNCCFLVGDVGVGKTRSWRRTLVPMFSEASSSSALRPTNALHHSSSQPDHWKQTSDTNRLRPAQHHISLTLKTGSCCIFPFSAHLITNDHFTNHLSVLHPFSYRGF